MNRKGEIKKAADSFEAMVEEIVVMWGVSEQKARLIMKDELRRESLYMKRLDGFPIKRDRDN